jgi:hypothetical protein
MIMTRIPEPSSMDIVDCSHLFLISPKFAFYISCRASDIHDCGALFNISPVFTPCPVTVVTRFLLLPCGAGAGYGTVEGILNPRI